MPNKEKSILQPKNDVVFKALFSRGKPRITQAMLEAILKMKIDKLELDKSTDLLNENADDKNGRLDLRAIINGNTECDIEVQLVSNDNITERFLYYWAKMYAANLKIGDKIKIKSNLFDADNEKGANEEVEVEIKGLFDGHNEGGVTAAQELYENTLITDLDTAAKVYGNTEDTAVYQDATFFVKGDKNLDKVIKNIEKLDIDWQQYNLIKSSNNYPALQQSISGIYKIANKLFAGSLLFAGVTVSLLLFLWMNARKKEIAILLSLGISKAKIFGQFVIELVFVSIPAFIGSYFLAVYTASMIGNNILSKVTGTIAKQIAKQGVSSQLGGGAEVDGFNKTLTSLEINISPKLMIYVVLFMSIVLIISLLISSSSNLKKSPKELLIDTK